MYANLETLHLQLFSAPLLSECLNQHCHSSSRGFEPLFTASIHTKTRWNRFEIYPWLISNRTLQTFPNKDMFGKKTITKNLLTMHYTIWQENYQDNFLLIRYEAIGEIVFPITTRFLLPFNYSGLTRNGMTTFEKIVVFQKQRKRRVKHTRNWMELNGTDLNKKNVKNQLPKWSKKETNEKHRHYRLNPTN